jgi:hypothetical protein
MNLGAEAILVDAIGELVQIYRFDEFRISITGGGHNVEFDVPSTEWLEHFTQVLRSRQPTDFNLTLRASGYYFHVIRTDHGLELFVFDRLSEKNVRLRLNFAEAKKLHDTVLETVLRPFVEQGGNVDNLVDLRSFHVGNDDTQ